MKTISSPMQSISILIVEDDEDSKAILVAIIDKKYPDLTIHTAKNGKAGLELFKEYLPDIVITDINMPEMNGSQMADKIRAIKTDVSIIVLTADSGKINLDNVVGKGFEINHYILKPLDFNKLFAAIEKCLGEIKQLRSRQVSLSK